MDESHFTILGATAFLLTALSQMSAIMSDPAKASKAKMIIMVFGPTALGAVGASFFVSGQMGLGVVVLLMAGFLQIGIYLVVNDKKTDRLANVGMAMTCAFMVAIPLMYFQIRHIQATASMVDAVRLMTKNEANKTD